MFEMWGYIWWGWLILLAVFFLGFASQHMKFSKTLAYVVSIMLIYFFVVRHPVWGSIWFVLSFIFTTGIYWPGVTLFKMGADQVIRKKYADTIRAEGMEGSQSRVGSGLPQFGGNM